MRKCKVPLAKAQPKKRAELFTPGIGFCSKILLEPCKSWDIAFYGEEYVSLYPRVGGHTTNCLKLSIDRDTFELYFKKVEV